MTFDEILDQAIEMLQRRGRVSYRALKRQFNLDDETLDDLKEELLYSHPEIFDDEGRGLVWTGDSASPEPEAHREANAESRFHAMLSVAISLLRQERRVTYRTLKLAFGIDDMILHELREELTLRQLGVDEDGKVLVWAGDTQGTATIDPPYAISTDVSSEEPTDSPEPIHAVPDAERRQLTVMFCDLADSTKLSQQLDPEDLREVIRAYQATAAKIIQQYEGHVAQYLGDGLLVYFGWPIAHEDDAQRAAHAGLGVVEATVRTLNPRLAADNGIQLTVRIGIHTGPVVVGEMGGGARSENLATGETVNIAARLEGLAQPNTVVISNVTERLTRDAFELDDLGQHVLKGVAEPIGVFRVLGAYDTDADGEASLPDGGVFLVGRGEEVGLLLRRWEQSKEGLGQAVLISGEAGIGKSSLVTTLRQQVRQEGCARLTFRCSPYHTNSALYPVIEYVQRVLQFQPGDTPATRLDKLERGLGGYSRAVEEVVPLFADLLSVPVPDGRYNALNLTPQQQREQTLDTLVAWLMEASEKQPVLAMWEDLHWADPSTLELLGLMVDQSPTAAILNVLTFRPEFEPPWSMRSHMTPIMLNRLERLQVEALITHLARDKTFPAEVVAHIVDKTDGVPLYIEELTKMLLVSGLLREEANHYVLTGPLSSLSIPTTLQDSLMARLDQMNTAKEVAQLGSVLGREFSYHMLHMLSDAEEGILQAELARLVRAELLYQRGRAPRARYIFKHALIQEAAYASLLIRTRQQAHHRVAENLVAHFPEISTTQPELVAHHYTEAGCYEQAMTYWQHAVERTRQRQALEETIEHCRQGLRLLSELPENDAHIQQEIVLQSALGASLQAAKGFGSTEAKQANERAWQRCRQLGDVPQLFPVLSGLWGFSFVSADYRTAQELSKQLLTIAQRSEDSQRLTKAHFHSGIIALFRGDFKGAQTHVIQGIRNYDAQHHSDLVSIAQFDPGVGCYIYLAEALRLLGYGDQAAKKMQTALQMARDLNHPFTSGYALLIAPRFHIWRREWSLAIAHAEALLALADTHGFEQFAAQGLMYQGYALAKQGNLEEGVARIQERNARAYLASLIGHGYHRLLCCDVDAMIGQREQALKSLDDILLQDERTGEGYSIAEGYRLKGEWLQELDDGHQVQAETSFQQALSIARRQDSKWGELRAATSLARLWQSQGKRQEAHDLLASVYNWFTEGFDTADLKDAKALLEELG